MTEEEKAAVIGYVRMGATLQHIASVTLIPFWIIQNIVEGYNEKLPKHQSLIIKTN